MTCAEANKIDLVEYLFSLGFTPAKIRGNDYWYLSPLRNEKEASFKVNKTKNAWYDHGEGKGGTVVDFVTAYFSCDVSTALQKISSYQQTPRKRFVSDETPGSVILPEVHQQALFDPQNNRLNTAQNNQRPPFHLYENSLINHLDAAETAIEILASKTPVTDLMLCRYLKERRIDKNIADRYCYEVTFKFSHKDASYTAIGFKNSAGGYELRNSFFKLSSSPKYITYINNFEKNNDIKTGEVKNNFGVSNTIENEEKKVDSNLSDDTSIRSQSDAVKSNLINTEKWKTENENQYLEKQNSIAVFEGFFDFLSYQTIHQTQTELQTDFLILNSLAFFERSLLLMDQHERISLYLDHDEAGKKCLDIALKRSVKYKDESSLYKGYKDLNDWVINFGKTDKNCSLKKSTGLKF